MIARAAFLVWVACWLLGCTGSQATTTSTFVGFDVPVDGRVVRASVWVPPDYDPDREWPLIVFLHGLGERGEDGLGQTRVGIGPAILKNPERFPCLVLLPQCPSDRLWSSLDASWASGIPGAADVVEASLQHVLEEYSVDPERIALTGLSMGGFGTFLYGADHVDRYRALVPICGGGDVSDAASLAKRPIWVIHGGSDTLVLPELSREMVAAIQKEGGDVRYTEYEGVGHDSWTRAYADPDVIDFLLDPPTDH